MSSEDVHDDSHVDKGKGRAAAPEPTEYTPLLRDAATSDTPEPEVENAPSHRRTFWRRLATVFLVSLSLTIFAVLILVIIAYSYHSRTSDISPEDILQHALVVKGPNRVDVLNKTDDGGIWVRVHCKIGLDAGAVVGVNTEAEDSVLQGVWKSLGRWGIHQLDKVTVNISDIVVFPENDPTQPLTSITLPPLEVPLTSNPPPDATWLTDMAIPALIRPTRNVSIVIGFLRDSWREGRLSVKTQVPQVFVRGGGLDESGWRTQLQLLRENIKTAVHIKIPALPGLPPPGTLPLPVLSELVTLKRFSLFSAGKSLHINASASVVDPVPLPFAFDFTVPAAPFVVSLRPPGSTPLVSLVPVAEVFTQPFKLTHPNITVAINGTVLPLSSNASTVVSKLIGNYVSGRESDIVLNTPLFPNITVDAKFPGAYPKPQILRNVTIKDMKIKGIGQGMTASGMIMARVVLPRGVNVGVNVVRVFPDVLVYDGEVPSDAQLWLPSTQGGPPTRPLPDPLPERAFAHIAPDEWLPSDSEPVDHGDDVGTVVAVQAAITDVPLQVLPGREREFSNFVSKVIFGSEGAIAGIQGTAAVAVHVQGLPLNGDGDMELSGLPFKGRVRIGKKAMLDDDEDE